MRKDARTHLASRAEHVLDLAMALVPRPLPRTPARRSGLRSSSPERRGRAPYTVRRWLREGRLKRIRMKGEVPGDDDALRAPCLVPREELGKLHAKGWIRSASQESAGAEVAVAEAEKKGPGRPT
jgi:hypothetical protein